MIHSFKNVAQAPLHALAVFSSAHSFRDNPIIGSPRLNAMGLHRSRVSLAHNIAMNRRVRLAHMVAEEDRDAFSRQGYVIKQNLLPVAVFDRLREQVFAHRAPAREMLQGDTVTRRIAVDADMFAAAPELKQLLHDTAWHGLTRYVGSFDQEPVTYIQTILSRIRKGKPDPQIDLHADTFHPTVKAWFFLTDVAEDEGPFCYVPGSHRLTPERLAWEHDMSCYAAGHANRYTARGSFRVQSKELDAMGLGPAKLLAVPANTLVVADTFGFHARGPSTRPSMRIELWGYGRRNPFLPWCGGDLLSQPGLAERRVPSYWKALDLRERLTGRRSPWRPAGLIHPNQTSG